MFTRRPLSRLTFFYRWLGRGRSGAIAGRRSPAGLWFAAGLCLLTGLWLVAGLVVGGAAYADQGVAAPDDVTVNAEETKTVRLLTIGNSFSQNATKYLSGLVEAAGHELVHQPLAIGGATLELHANKGRDWQSDPNHKNGKYNTGKSLQETLQSQPWDVVTIQQASMRSHRLDSYEPHAQWLAETIRQLAPTARLHVHQTWAYRVDDPRFQQPPSRPGEPASQEAMYRGLTDAYEATAARWEAELIPVGTAFYRFDTDPVWGYQPDASFDFEQAAAPQLPNQQHSLHVGWRWQTKDGTPQLTIDGHHANQAGEYLGACVWFEKLYGQSVLDNAFVPPGLAPELAEQLRRVAHETVAASAAVEPVNP